MAEPINRKVCLCLFLNGLCIRFIATAILKDSGIFLLFLILINTYNYNSTIPTKCLALMTENVICSGCLICGASVSAIAHLKIKEINLRPKFENVFFVLYLPNIFVLGR